MEKMPKSQSRWGLSHFGSIFYPLRASLPTSLNQGYSFKTLPKQNWEF